MPGFEISKKPVEKDPFCIVLKPCKDAPHGYRVGDSVFHKIRGRGTVHPVGLGKGGKTIAVQFEDDKQNKNYQTNVGILRFQFVSPAMLIPGREVIQRGGDRVRYDPDPIERFFSCMKGR